MAYRASMLRFYRFVKKLLGTLQRGDIGFNFKQVTSNGAETKAGLRGWVWCAACLAVLRPTSATKSRSGFAVGGFAVPREW